MTVRVLHCVESIISGGVEVSKLEFVRHPANRDFEHLFLCTFAEGPILEMLKDYGARVIALGAVPSVFDRARYRSALEIAKRWSPHIVHGAVMEGVVLAAVTGRIRRIPTITEETSDPADRYQGGHALAALAMHSADLCLAISPFVGRYLRERLHVPDSKIRVIEYGVKAPDPQSQEQRSRLRATLGIAPDDIVVGMVSRLYDDHKRVSDMIVAVNSLLDRHPTLNFVIVGDGPDKEALQQQAATTGRGDRFHFVGRQIPADPFYAIMDVFGTAPAREGFGIVAAEAMHAGLPVVATKVGGLGDIVRNGVTGILVPPHSPAVLSSALERLITDPGLRKSMGEAGRMRANFRYRQDRYVSEIATLYREVLDYRHFFSRRV